MAQIGTRLSAILVFLFCIGLSGCFESQAGGPGLEPPIEVGPPRGAAGDFGNTSGGAGGVLDPSSGSDPSPPNDSTTGAGGAGGVVAPGTDGGASAPTDAGAPDAQVDPATASCAELDVAYTAALAEAQACSTGDSCTHTFIGSGCSDGLAPLCGFAHRDGADVEYITALDLAYREAGCASGSPIACASCVVPGAATCVGGVCVSD